MYHLTTEEDYLSMLKDKRIHVSQINKHNALEGVYMFDLINHLKRWGHSNDWSGHLGQRLLGLKQGNHPNTNKIVLLKIPTENISKEKILIRSQNKLFANMREFTEARINYIFGNVRPNEKLKHLFSGDSAKNSRLYKQRKEAIEYIYPENIALLKAEKIGELIYNDMSIDRLNNRGVNKIYSNLLKGTPEEKALVLLKD